MIGVGSLMLVFIVVLRLVPTGSNLVTWLRTQGFTWNLELYIIEQLKLDRIVSSKAEQF